MEVKPHIVEISNPMTLKNNVLILSAGRRVELVQSFQRALRRYFPDSSVLTTDVDPWLSAACHVADHYFASPPANNDEYIDFLIELCKKENVAIVIPTIDTELFSLSHHRDRFESVGTNVIISDETLVTACRDKRLLPQVFASLDIKQPDILDRSELVFPCFCKPYDGSSSVGAQILEGPDTFNRHVLDDEKNMFMEFIGKDYQEYTVDVYYTRDGKLRCLVPRQRLEVRGGEISKGVTRRNHVYDYLRVRLDRFEGARGCITLQVFFNPVNQDIKALEINPRFGGGFPLSHSAGADYPDWLLCEYLLEKDIPFFDAWQTDLLMLRYDAKVIVNCSQCMG